MNKIQSTSAVLALLFLNATAATANTLIDVGTGFAPDTPPYGGPSPPEPPTWTLSSSCVDINKSGQAACQTQALGPRWRCGSTKICQSSATQVYLWNGVDLERYSTAEAKADTPLAMNNLGHIVGYEDLGAAAANTGRIWYDPFTRTSKAQPVTSINDHGDHIVSEDNEGQVFDSSDTEYPYPADLLQPFVVSNNGEVIGGQILQTFESEDFSPTGNEIPEVSGVGWLLDQAEADAIGTDDEGLYNVDGKLLWQMIFYRPDGVTNYSTVAHDVNDAGDFVAQYTFNELYSGQYCSHEGETPYVDNGGGSKVAPWACEGTNYASGTDAGGKAFLGINNIGDAVGVFTPGVFDNQTAAINHPWVWLRNAAGSWDEYNANDLLPAGSDYKVVAIRDINDQREIVGTCTNGAGEQRGCILQVNDQPLPPPVEPPALSSLCCLSRLSPPGLPVGPFLP
jgi:hypothetical protein